MRTDPGRAPDDEPAEPRCLAADRLCSPADVVVDDADPWNAPVRGLLLDVDDTLLDTQTAMRASCARGAAVAWPELSQEVHREISNGFYDDPLGIFDAYTRGEVSFATMRAARYREACRRLGLPDQGFERFEGAYRAAFAGNQQLFDDTVTFLDAAAERGVAVGFVTNSGHEQTVVKLEVVGLRDRGPVVTTDTLGIGKPDPAIFCHALALLGTNASETVVVGDTHHSDIVGARAAGMRAAWLQRPGLREPRNAGWGIDVSDDPGIRIVPDLGAVLG